MAFDPAQQDPTFRTTLSYSRLTAEEALKQLRTQGESFDMLPCQSSMADILNRMGYRLRKVVKAKPQKKVPETAAIFDNIKEKDALAKSDAGIKRLSIDCKALAPIGNYSRGGKTRGDNQADDHFIRCAETYTPFGIFTDVSGQLHIMFGSSYKTSDFIVDSLIEWWYGLSMAERQSTTLIQMIVPNGPSIRGIRTQFLNRMVSFSESIEKPVQLRYYPPYHSKYNPIERCWGILERSLHGALLPDVETMLEWAKGMTWKGIHPLISLSQKVYEKGVKQTKKAMKGIEAKRKRNPLLPKWDLLIQPT